MLYHTVRSNDTLAKIAQIYHLQVEEIKELNQHVRSWDQLTPGTKLRMPEISERMNDHLDQVEPFIEDYYPRIDLSDLHASAPKVNEEKPISKPVTTSNNSSINLPNSSNYWPNPWMYGYPPYPYRYKRPPKTNNKKDAGK